MFIILLILFIIVPIIEITLFIKLGSLFGAFFTVSLIIFTAVFGAFLVRTQGIFTIIAIQKKMQQGDVPTVDILSGLLLGIAGILLIIPGFFTDAIGFLLLIPMIRKGCALLLINHVFTHVNVYSNRTFDSDTIEGSFSTHHEQSSILKKDHIIEGEFEERK